MDKEKIKTEIKKHLKIGFLNGKNPEYAAFEIKNILENMLIEAIQECAKEVHFNEN